MLRVTVHNNPQVLTLQLEGSLAGPCLRELATCWENALASQGNSGLRVDLTGVTHIDAAGKACLAAMHRRGAEFVAADCLTRAIVAEIIDDRAIRREVGPEPCEQADRKNSDWEGEQRGLEKQA